MERDADGLLTMPPPSHFTPAAAADPDDVPPPAPEPLASLGVVSYNIHRIQPLDAFTAEALRLTALPGVALVGWQEAMVHRASFPPLLERGWETAYFTGSKENPISWDTAVFEYVDAAQHPMHEPYPGASGVVRPARWVSHVTLRHRATGFKVSVLNTHVASRGESWEQLGTWNENATAPRVRQHLLRMSQIWQNVPGRYVIGTGDFNIDARADAAKVMPGGLVDRFRHRAVSNWQALGMEATPKTLDLPVGPNQGAPLLYDYVFASARCVDARWLRFVSQEALTGWNSDHTPLLVRFELF